MNLHNKGNIFCLQPIQTSRLTGLIPGATYLPGNCTTHRDKAREGAEDCGWGLMEGTLTLG